MVASSFDGVFSDHVEHLVVTLNQGDMMLEDLRSPASQQLILGGKEEILTSGHGICLAGCGPLPVHLRGPPRNPPPFMLGPSSRLFGGL